MSEPSERTDREFAVELVDEIFGFTCEFNSTPPYHISLYDRLEERLTRARAEGDQAGYERGRREAIEECAKIAARYNDNRVATAIRALADPATQPASQPQEQSA